MNFRNQLKKPQTMIRIGMLCLLIALIWPRFIPLTFNCGPDLIDAARGVLFGLSIGLNLWAAKLTGRQQRCGDGK